MVRHSLVATVLGSLVYFGLLTNQIELTLPDSSEVESPRVATNPRVVPSRSASLSDSAIFAQGRIEGISEEIQLRFQFDGRVVERLAEPGQRVAANQTLLRIDSQQQTLEVALAESNLLEAQSQLERLENGAHEFERRESEFRYQAKLAEMERAQLLWQRADHLRVGNVIAQQEFDESRTALSALRAQARGAEARMNLLNAGPRQDELRTAKARVAAAQSRLELAKVQLSRVDLLAPHSGQVLDVSAKVGEMSGPGTASPAVTFVDTSRYRVRAFVEELEAPRVRIGMTAHIRADGLQNKLLSGIVTQVSPMMRRKELRGHESTERLDTHAREVWVDLEDCGELIIGLRVDVTINGN